MENYAVDEGKEKPPRRGLVHGILAAGLLIAFGLAFGLGFGLRHFVQDLVYLTESTTPLPTTTPAPTVKKSNTGEYRFASVASDLKECSTIGTEFLAKGGSAVDAAIATSICMSVGSPNNCGIGGGFFMTVYNRGTQTADVLDARERAPLAANSTLFVGREAAASRIGGLAIGVPGEIMGYWEAHQRYGKLPWKDLFQPSIKLCREGSKIGSYLAYAIERNKDSLWSQNITVYFKPNSRVTLKEGDVVKYPHLADTLEAIANQGASAFYNGSLTDIIVQEIQENGGIITRVDLTDYTATWRTPVKFTLRDGHTMYSVPPPGSGTVLEYMLNILDGYNFNKDSISTDEKSILTYHRIVEAMKFAFAKRTLLGDEDFVNVTELVRNMTSRDFGDSIRARINDTRTQDTDYYEPSFFNQEDQGTTQISVVDVEGNAVSLTSTINFFFGAQVLGKTTGIWYNNEMDDFSTPGVVNIYGLSASPANFIEPGKRPLSSMCPTVVVDNATDVVLVLGGSGGTRITTASALIALQILKFGRSAGEAVNHKRLHHQLLPHLLQVEEGFPQAIEEGLKAKGHNTTAMTIPPNINIVSIQGGRKTAVSDYRKGGSPDGY